MSRREFFKTVLSKGTLNKKVQLEESMSVTNNFHDFAEYVSVKVKLNK